MKVIKYIIKDIYVLLSAAFNSLFVAGVFPDALKYAKVVPVFKYGDKFNITIYRPISVLPILSRILEKLMYNRLISFMNSFSYAGQLAWNSLPNYLKESSLTLVMFKESLKIFLFSRYQHIECIRDVCMLVCYRNLYLHLHSCKVLCDNQFDFRQRHSTYMALLNIKDRISASIDDGKYTIGIFLDFSKAFDTINYDS